MGNMTNIFTYNEILLTLIKMNKACHLHQHE